MATERAINYAKALIKKNGGDPSKYKFNEEIPGGYDTPMSNLIGGLKEGRIVPYTEWNGYVDSLQEGNTEEPIEQKEDLKALFTPYLAGIASTKIRGLIALGLDKAPEYFYRVAASSTGKYHPDYALGTGGLVRHTIAAVKIAKTLLENPIYGAQYSSEEKDIIIGALILHDTQKHGNKGSQYTVHEHPLLVRNALDVEAKLFYTESEYNDISLIIDDLAVLIESHMGPWTENRRSSVVLPRPTTTMQVFVHTCDYLASRKFIEIKF